MTIHDLIPRFCVYYGWLNVVHDWSPYSFVIFADQHPDRRNRLEDLIAEVPETYFYIDALGISQLNPPLETLLDTLEQLNISGIFLDRFNTSELTDRVTLNLIQTLKDRHFKIIGNGEITPQFLSSIDKCMIEGFLGSFIGTPDNFQYDYAPFIPTEEKVQHLSAHNTEIIAISYGAENNLDKEIYCYLSTLLFDLNAFCYANPSLMTPYAPNVSYDLGKPLDRYHLMKGVFVREFEKGTIIIDPIKQISSIKPR